MKSKQNMHKDQPKQARFSAHKATGRHAAAHPSPAGKVGPGNCANAAKKK